MLEELIYRLLDAQRTKTNVDRIWDHLQSMDHRILYSSAPGEPAGNPASGGESSFDPLAKQ